MTDDVSVDDVWLVLVDVTSTVVVDRDEGETVTTDELALEVAADEVSEDEVVPPVLNATLWRFAIDIATSRSLAETDDTAKRARRRVMASERILTMASSAWQAR